MATNTLSILKPSVNNLTTRIFVRAAGLDYEELDVWGKKSTPEFLAKDPADLTPLLEESGLPKGSLWESCAIMQYLCNKHGLDEFYPSDPGERAMVNSAMFYLTGTLYPLLARATYPALGFGQYPGEVATSDADDEMKARAQGVHDGDGDGPRRRLLGARGGRSRLHRLREVAEQLIGRASVRHQRRPSSRAAFSFRISGRTSSLNGACSKSASQRSGVISGKSEPKRTFVRSCVFAYLTSCGGKYFGDQPERSIHTFSLWRQTEIASSCHGKE